MSSTQEVGDIFGSGKGPAHAMLRSPTVLIVSVGLWGMNVFFFRLFGINYKYVLNYDLMVEKQQQLSSNNNNNNPKDRNSTSITDLELSMHNNSNSGVGMGGTSAKTPTSTTTTTSTVTCNSDHGTTNTSSTTSKRGFGIMVSSSDPPPPLLSLPVEATKMMHDTNTDDDINDYYTSEEDHDDLYFLGGGAGMDYDFPQEQQYYGGAAITWYKLVLFSMILLVLLHVTTHFWMDHLHKGVVGAVLFFYAAVLVYIFLPLSSNKWLRRSFAIVLWRSLELIHPRCYCLRCKFYGNSSTTSTTTTTSPATSTSSTSAASKSKTILMTNASSTTTAVPSSAGCNLPVTSTLSNTNNNTMFIRPIPFLDVFYADAMCSLSKVFFDWGMLIQMAIHYPNRVPQSISAIVVPSACAAIPFLIRARQCLVMHSIASMKKDIKAKWQHLANALKYSTSIFPLCLSAYQKTQDSSRAEELEGYLIFLLTVNALYALYWDIVMDWGMMQDPTAVVKHACVGASSAMTLHAAAETKQILPISNSNIINANNSKTGNTNCHHVVLRPRLRFGLTMSTLIVLADTCLRFSWLLRFLGTNYTAKLFPSQDAFILTTQFLEVFRRALWNLLRVEWETIKQQQQKSIRRFKARDSLSDNEDDDDVYGVDDEKVKLLSSSSSLVASSTSAILPTMQQVGSVVSHHTRDGSGSGVGGGGGIITAVNKPVIPGMAHKVAKSLKN